jgi:hypothetical protein
LTFLNHANARAATSIRAASSKTRRRVRKYCIRITSRDIETFGVDESRRNTGAIQVPFHHVHHWSGTTDEVLESIARIFRDMPIEQILADPAALCRQTVIRIFENERNFQSQGFLKLKKIFPEDRPFSITASVNQDHGPLILCVIERSQNAHHRRDANPPGNQYKSSATGEIRYKRAVWSFNESGTADLDVPDRRGEVTKLADREFDAARTHRTGGNRKGVLLHRKRRRSDRQPCELSRFECHSGMAYRFEGERPCAEPLTSPVDDAIRPTLHHQWFDQTHVTQQQQRRHGQPDPDKSLPALHDVPTHLKNVNECDDDNEYAKQPMRKAPPFIRDPPGTSLERSRLYWH